MNITYDLNYDDLDDVDYDVTLFRVDADSHILTDDEFDAKLAILLDYVYPVKYRYIWFMSVDFLNAHIEVVVNKILPCVQRSHLANDNPVGKLPAVAGLKNR